MFSVALVYHSSAHQRRSAVCCRDQAQEPSAVGWLERQFLQQALMCRSVEVFGSHVGYVLSARHFSQANNFVTYGILDPQPTNLYVSWSLQRQFENTSQSLPSSSFRRRY